MTIAFLCDYSVATILKYRASSWKLLNFVCMRQKLSNDMKGSKAAKPVVITKLIGTCKVNGIISTRLECFKKLMSKYEYLLDALLKWPIFLLFYRHIFTNYIFYV